MRRIMAIRQSNERQGSWLYPLVVTAALFCASGCNVAMPQLYRPGHAREQQLRATFHDPYGSPDIGPAIVGGRPIDFMQPRPLPVQSQWFLGQ